MIWSLCYVSLCTLRLYKTMIKVLLLEHLLVFLLIHSHLHLLLLHPSDFFLVLLFFLFLHLLLLLFDLIILSEQCLGIFEAFFDFLQDLGL